MLSEKQLAANRANAQKSTGPRTPIGRRKSSQSSLRHGMLARTILIQGESRHRFLALLANLQRELLPTTPIEHDLVDTLAVCRWRQMRLWSLEQAGLDHQMTQPAESPRPETPCPEPSYPLFAFQALAGQSPALDSLNRYERTLDRQFHRTLTRLFSYRKERDLAKRTHLSSVESTKSGE